MNFLILILKCKKKLVFQISQWFDEFDDLLENQSGGSAQAFKLTSLTKGNLKSISQGVLTILVVVMCAFCGNWASTTMYMLNIKVAYIRFDLKWYFVVNISMF